MQRPFADLLTDGQYRVALQEFTRAIERSFRQRPVRHMTQQHVKDRFAICERIFRQLRGDLKWGLERIWGHLPAYLVAELDGKPWSPDQRTIWTPD